MNKRLLALLSVLVLASMMLAACGAQATEAPAATEAAMTEGPAATEAPATTAPVESMGTLKIVSSLPMTGSSLTQT